MSKATFNLQNLHKIKNLNEAWDEELKMLVIDCRERPGLKKSRKLSLELEITPSEADPDDVVIHPQLKCKSPNVVLEPYRMQSTSNGQLKFQPNSPMQPDQTDLDFEE